MYYQKKKSSSSRRRQRSPSRRRGEFDEIQGWSSTGDGDGCCSLNSLESDSGGSYRKMDSRAEIVRKRQEDDDEMMLFLFPAMYLLSSNGGRKKRARHTSRLPGKERLREILEGHPKDSCVAFRMEPNIFREIADFLRREHLLRDTRGLKVEERLGLFLFMLSHNASYEDLQYEFKHSGETIHRHIRAMFNIIPTLTHRFVKPAVGVGVHWKIRPFASRSEKDFAPPNASRVEKGSALSNARRMEGRKQKQDNVAGMMQKYLEVRMIQVEGEVADKAMAVAEADDFSIKNCISHLNTIEELSGEERAEAFDVFKDAQNRQIFMTAEPISRLIWLRKEMRKISQVV